ncbi:MAG: carboxy-S-adenosyl-L-methionine synthase CmoA [Lysobacterales bacterium]
MSHTKDRIFSIANSEPSSPFEFNDAVAQVFPDMLSRSVPGYATTLSTIAAMAGRYAQPHTHCYDLGCSLGAATLAMRQAIADPTVKVVGVDNAPAMIKRGQEILDESGDQSPVSIELGDINDFPLRPASVVVLNFTLQFVPIEQRTELLTRIANALLPGGVLVLSEKIAFDTASSDELFVDLYHAFKRNQGYSELEIARKRSALENVLIRETLTEHRQRLTDAGFSTVEQWFQCFNFASLIAFK